MLSAGSRTECDESWGKLSKHGLVNLGVPLVHLVLGESFEQA
jgi:hypothetical protein